MKLFKPELSDLLGAIKTQLPRLQKLKAETKERIRRERQCAGTTQKGDRCRAWAVAGDPDNVCIRHGGAKTAVIPKKMRSPSCLCPAYTFPHRRRSGFCNYPNEPFKEHPTPQGQRRYYKRIRKSQIKTWLKELGMQQETK